MGVGIDLDRQCALAQGWVRNGPKSPFAIWTDKTGMAHNGPVSFYHPSTNFNQAVAFAEWAVKTQLENTFIDICFDQQLEWEVEIREYGKEQLAFSAGSSVAEALCRATLKALGKEE